MSDQAAALAGARSKSRLRDLRVSLNSSSGRLALQLLILLGLCHAFSGVARAERLVARVVSITDGDTLVAATEHDRFAVRLAGIDAPNRIQPYGQEARANLARLAFNKDVYLDCHGAGPSATRVCSVWIRSTSCPTCSGDLDVGLAQISDGMARSRAELGHGQSAETRQRYAQAQAIAALRRIGLWRHSRAMPP